MGVRDTLRRRIRDGLRVLSMRRDEIAPPSPPSPTQGAAPDEPLGPSDVRLDALHVLDRQGIGWDLAFIDVRQPREIAADGTLPGALRIPLGEIEGRRSEIPDDVDVVLVCSAGGRSTEGALRLRALGHGLAWSLDGGLLAWRRAGGEVEPP